MSSTRSPKSQTLDYGRVLYIFTRIIESLGLSYCKVIILSVGLSYRVGMETGFSAGHLLFSDPQRDACWKVAAVVLNLVSTLGLPSISAIQSMKAENHGIYKPGKVVTLLYRVS